MPSFECGVFFVASIELTIVRIRTHTFVFPSALIRYRFVLQGLLSDEEISECPVLVLGNKIDKHGKLICSTSPVKRVQTTWSNPAMCTVGRPLLRTDLQCKQPPTSSHTHTLSFLSTIRCLLSGSAHEDELKAALGLGGQTTGKGKIPRSELSGRPIEIFMCSVKRRTGYGDGKTLAPFSCGHETHQLVHTFCLPVQCKTPFLKHAQSDM